MKYLVALFSGVLLAVNCSAQDCKVVPPVAMENLKMNISFLASDELEGRLPGTRGAEEASGFIAKRFQEFGLVPFSGNGSYFQSFEISDWAKINKKKTKLTVDGESKKLN